MKDSPLPHCAEGEPRVAAKIGMGRLVLLAVVRIVLAFGILFGTLFGASGRLDWTGAWLFLGGMLACVVVNAAVLIAVNPEVVQQRMTRNGRAKPWDVVVTSVLSTVLLAVLIVAGVDRRWAWSPALPGWLPAAGLTLLALGNLLVLWAMSVNKFFARVVRIQKERGHHVVTAGPYQYIRHPGYAGWIVLALGVPMILGSLWAYVAVGLAIAGLVVRTALEDRTLREELEAYRSYAAKVRYRLLPGIW